MTLEKLKRALEVGHGLKPRPQFHVEERQHRSGPPAEPEATGREQVPHQRLQKGASCATPSASLAVWTAPLFGRTSLFASNLISQLQDNVDPMNVVAEQERNLIWCQHMIENSSRPHHEYPQRQLISDATTRPETSQCS